MASPVGSIFIALDADLGGLVTKFKDGEKRVGDFSARANRSLGGFDRNMKGVIGTVDLFHGGLTKAFGGAGLGGLIRNLGAGALGLVGLTASFKGIHAAISDVAKIGQDAQRAGNMSVTSFQELAYAARQARVPIESVIAGMKDMQQRADAFITTAKGPAAEAFKRLGLRPEQLKTQLKDPADLLNTIINRVGQLARPAQIRILDEIFGGSAGEQFLKFIDQGKNGIQRLRAEARTTGEVISKEMVERAADIEKRFDNLKNKVGVELKKAILDAAYALDEFIKRLPGREVPVEDIGKRIVAITKELLEWETQLADARDTASKTGMDVDRDRVKLIEQRIAKLKEEEEALKKRGWAATLSPPKVEPFQPAKNNDYAGGNIQKVLSEYDKAIQRAKENTAVKLAETEALRSQNVLLNDYGYALSKARMQRELMNVAERQAKENGTVVTTAQIAQIDEVASAYARAEAEARRLAKTQEENRKRVEEFRTLGKEAVGGFISDLRNGVSTADALTNALRRIESKLLDMVLNDLFSVGGGGGLLRMLGSFFGGFGFFAKGGEVKGFATGGAVSGPGTGESDSILARLSNGEFVVNAESTRRHRGLLEAINAGHELRLPAFAQGGIVMPASAPLSSALSAIDAADGPSVEVHIHNVPADTTATTKTSVKPGGGFRLDVELSNRVDEIMAAKIRTGGSKTNQAIEQRYRMDPTRGIG